MIANNESTVAAAAAKWSDFVSATINSPAPVVYSKIALGKYSVVAGKSSPETVSLTCSNASISGKIMRAMGSGVALSVDCDGTKWHYIVSNAGKGRRMLASSSSGVLCAGCSSPTMDLCSKTNTTVVIGYSKPCYRNGQIIKTSVQVGITKTPIVATTTPIVSNITILGIGKYNITALIAYTGQAPGGTIYCAAVKSNVEITNTNQVQDSAQDTSVFFLSQSSVLKDTLILGGLIPAYTYNVYCTGVDSIGNTAPFTNVLDTQQLGVKTLCCRSISFTNAPRTIYGRVVKIPTFICRFISYFSFFYFFPICRRLKQIHWDIHSIEHVRVLVRS